MTVAKADVKMNSANKIFLPWKKQIHDRNLRSSVMRMSGILGPVANLKAVTSSIVTIISKKIVDLFRSPFPQLICHDTVFGGYHGHESRVTCLGFDDGLFFLIQPENKHWLSM